MNSLKIYEQDLSEQFVLAPGKGGQKVNKTASCVQLRHFPSNIEIKCSTSRSQAQNRYYARKDLCEKIEEKTEGIKSARQQKNEKIRRQKRKRSRRAKNRMLDDKSKHADKKALRRKPDH